MSTLVEITDSGMVDGEAAWIQLATGETLVWEWDKLLRLANAGIGLDYTLRSTPRLVLRNCSVVFDGKQITKILRSRNEP